MNRNKLHFGAGQAKILEIIKKSIDKDHKEKRRSFQKLLEKVTMKIHVSKLH